MGDVIDTADDHATAGLFDHRDRGVLDLERKESAARPADNPTQSDLGHTAMGDHQHLAPLMAIEDRLQRSRDARLEHTSALAAWDEIPVGFLLPGSPRLWITLGDLDRSQPLPFAQENLAQLRHGGRLDSERSSDELRRLECPLQV